MKEGFNLGVRVRNGNSSAFGTLVEGPANPDGWRFPHYANHGFYFVKWDIRDEIFVAHEDDLFLISVDDRYRAAALEHVIDGDLELDPDAVVSISPDGGAYVQMWKWIDQEELVSSEGPPPYDAATATGMYDHDE